MIKFEQLIQDQKASINYGGITKNFSANNHTDDGLGTDRKQLGSIDYENRNHYKSLQN